MNLRRARQSQIPHLQLQQIRVPGLSTRAEWRTEVIRLLLTMFRQHEHDIQDQLRTARQLGARIRPEPCKIDEGEVIRNEFPERAVGTGEFVRVDGGGAGELAVHGIEELADCVRAKGGDEVLVREDVELDQGEGVGEGDFFVVGGSGERACVEPVDEQADDAGILGGEGNGPFEVLFEMSFCLEGGGENIGGVAD